MTETTTTTEALSLELLALRWADASHARARAERVAEEAQIRASQARNDEQIAENSLRTMALKNVAASRGVAIAIYGGRSVVVVGHSTSTYVAPVVGATMTNEEGE